MSAVATESIPGPAPLAWAADLPMVLSEVEVVSTERLSPAFVRLVLAGPGLAEVGLEAPGPDGAYSDATWWDQRFKLIVPDASGAITGVEGADASWLNTWMDRDVSERGHMRTYTIRELHGEGDARRLVVDVVLHPDTEHPPGPGARWAEEAVPGSRAVVLLPRRGHPFGGIEFVPGQATQLLLVGDETAVPAICAILEHLPPSARGAAFLEVPADEDVLGVSTASGLAVHWLPRNGRRRGEPAQEAVFSHLAELGRTDLGRAIAVPETFDAEAVVDEVDPELWETPSYSSSGEAIAEGADEGSSSPLAGLYAWIGGESLVVTAMRRHLVKEVGVDRSQVSFMGYWRRGVAMKS